MTTMKQTTLFQGQEATTKATMKKARTSAVVSPGEKSLEKTTDSSAKEIAKQPAPDPEHFQTITYHETLEYKIDWKKEITLRALESLGNAVVVNYKHEPKLLGRWEEAFPDSFDDTAERFDLFCPFDMFGDDQKYTWRQGAEAIFDNCGRDMETFAQQLDVVWNRELLRDPPDEDEKSFDWILRRFSYSLAYSDPAALFHIEEEDKKDESGQWMFQNSYWKTELWSNPTLMIPSCPLAMMWACSASFLGHPWAFQEGYPNVFDKLSHFARQKARLQRSKKARRAEIKKAVQDKKKRARKRDDMSEDEDNADEARLKAPVPPGSPDKMGVRFRTEPEKQEDGFEDTVMGEDDEYEDFEDSVEELADQMKKEMQEDKRSKKTLYSVSSRNDEHDTSISTSDVSEDQSKFNKVKPALTRESGSPSDFFAPRVPRSVKQGQPKTLVLSPKDAPKPSKKNGVAAANFTDEDIEESGQEEALDGNQAESSDSSNDDVYSSDDEEVKIISPPAVSRRRNSESSEHSDEIDDGEAEFDDESPSAGAGKDALQHALNKRESLRLKSREMRKKLNEETRRKDTTKSKASALSMKQSDSEGVDKETDPYDGIETTNGLYRRNSLSLEDAMVVDEIDKEENRVNQNVANTSPEVGSAANRQSYRAAVAAPSMVPTEQLIRKLLQMNMDGLPCRDCKFFYLFFAFMWNGQAAGTSITKKALQVMQNFLIALFKTGFRFKLLPLSDAKYKNQKLWIDNPERLKQLMGTWYQAKNYIDMSYGNADWISSMARTPGNKILRTRMRFAFDDTYEGAKATIGGILEEEGGYVRDSPLQFDNIDICGHLPFLPGMMSPEIMANAIMRELNYEEPIALVWEYVSCPSSKTSGQANMKAPSTQMWGVVGRTKSLRKVDAGTKGVYCPSTPKSMMPYGAISTYFHNWRAASKNLLSVGPYGPVKEMATSLVMKAIDFKSVTETFCSPIPIPGLLKVVDTSKFGKISLLRFLYSYITESLIELSNYESIDCRY